MRGMPSVRLLLLADGEQARSICGAKGARETTVHYDAGREAATLPASMPVRSAACCSALAGAGFALVCAGGARAENAELTVLLACAAPPPYPPRWVWDDAKSG